MGEIEKPYDERSWAGNDFAIFRHHFDPWNHESSLKKEQCERVVNEAEFSRFFDHIKQEKREVLETIECVQSCVRAK